MSTLPHCNLTTAASWYIGSVVTEFAIAEGYEVHGLSLSEKSDAKLTGLGVAPVRGDLSSFDVLRQESSHAHCVLHLTDSLADDWHRDYQEVVRIDAAAVHAIGEGLQGPTKNLTMKDSLL